MALKPIKTIGYGRLTRPVAKVERGEKSKTKIVILYRLSSLIFLKTVYWKLQFHVKVIDITLWVRTSSKTKLAKLYRPNWPGNLLFLENYYMGQVGIPILHCKVHPPSFLEQSDRIAIHRYFYGFDYRFITKFQPITEKVKWFCKIFRYWMISWGNV